MDMRAAVCLALLALAGLLAPSHAVRVLQQSEDAAALAAPAPAPAGEAPAPAPAAADALELLPAEMGTYVLQEPETEPSVGRTVEWKGQELQLQDGKLATIGEVPEADGARAAAHASWGRAGSCVGRCAAHLYCCTALDAAGLCGTVSNGRLI